MGQLKPGSSYIYEYVDGITYSIRDGDLNTRTEIGRILKKQTFNESLKENQLWHNIRQEAKSNPVLQDALERVKIIYELSKDNGKE